MESRWGLLLLLLAQNCGQERATDITSQFELPVHSDTCQLRDSHCELDALSARDVLNADLGQRLQPDTAALDSLDQWTGCLETGESPPTPVSLNCNDRFKEVCLISKLDYLTATGWKQSRSASIVGAVQISGDQIVAAYQTVDLEDGGQSHPKVVSWRMNGTINWISGIPVVPGRYFSTPAITPPIVVDNNRFIVGLSGVGAVGPYSESFLYTYSDSGALFIALGGSAIGADERAFASPTEGALLYPTSPLGYLRVDSSLEQVGTTPTVNGYAPIIACLGNALPCALILDAGGGFQVGYADGQGLLEPPSLVPGISAVTNGTLVASEQGYAWYALANNTQLCRTDLWPIAVDLLPTCWELPVPVTELVSVLTVGEIVVAEVTDDAGEHHMVVIDGKLDLHYGCGPEKIISALSNGTEFVLVSPRQIHVLAFGADKLYSSTIDLASTLDQDAEQLELERVTGANFGIDSNLMLYTDHGRVLVVGIAAVQDASVSLMPGWHTPNGDRFNRRRYVPN